SLSAASLLANPATPFVDRGRYEVEENLDNAIGLNAMFIAIGDKLASYGAAKMRVEEQDWQGTFRRLADSSMLIFMLPGPSAACLWELSQIVRSPGLLEKTIFIMPRERPKYPLHDVWQTTARMAAEFGVSFPPYSADGGYFRLGANGHPSDV